MAAGETEAMEHLHAAQAAGRGVVLSFPHYGNPYAQFHVLHRYGVDAHVIAGPHHFDAREGYARLFNRQGRRYIEVLGPGHAIVPPGSFGAAAAVLARGGVVSVAFDIAGTMPTPFLGREVSLASGSAALAHGTDALLVPFTIRRRGRLPIMRFAPALDPRDHADPRSLQAALAAVMEDWALERPDLRLALRHASRGSAARARPRPRDDLGPPAAGDADQRVECLAAREGVRPQGARRGGERPPRAGHDGDARGHEQPRRVAQRAGGPLQAGVPAEVGPGTAMMEEGVGAHERVGEGRGADRQRAPGGQAGEGLDVVGRAVGDELLATASRVVHGQSGHHGRGRLLRGRVEQQAQRVGARAGAVGQQPDPPRGLLQRGVQRGRGGHPGARPAADGEHVAHPFAPRPSRNARPSSARRARSPRCSRA